MKTSLAAALALLVLLTALGSTAGAEEPQADSAAGDSTPAGHGYPVGALSSDAQDPGNLVKGIRDRRTQKEAIFPVSPLHRLHELTDRGKKGPCCTAQR